MAIYTTEIASDKIKSDNPIHQRLLKPYLLVAERDMKDVLEIGCGEGRGTELILGKARNYTAVDKIGEILDTLAQKFPEGKFRQMNIPPLKGLADRSFDVVISFQVIEHIRNDALFLEEIARVLKPGGRAYITTPNRKMTLTRNPWHIREYLPDELSDLAAKYFDEVDMKGIGGNEKVLQYYEENRKSVQRITRFDIFNLQYRLPASLLRIPYDLLNRFNRNKLKDADNELVMSITADDYLLLKDPAEALDLFLTVRKSA